MQATGNRVFGNFIGTTSVGPLNIPFQVSNGHCGVFVEEGRQNLIGGTSAEEANWIAGNRLSGVDILGSTVKGSLAGEKNEVIGNFIGVAPGPIQGVGNGFAGVLIRAASGVLVGGPQESSGNIISGNQVGVEVLESTLVRIQGNYIGTDSGGTRPAANRSGGVKLTNSEDCLVGGSDAGLGNLISGHKGTQFETGYGVRIEGGRGHKIQGNRIGTDHTGSSNTALVPGDLGNDIGVEIVDSPGNVVGPLDSELGLEDPTKAIAARNLISGNQTGIIHNVDIDWGIIFIVEHY